MIGVQFNAGASRQALKNAIHAIEDLTPVYNDIGEYMVETTRQRFVSGTAPDGTRWAPKRQATLDRYKRLVYSIPRRYRLADHVCDDVFQTVFIKFFRSLRSITDHRAVPKWLMTTTHRECWRMSRSAGSGEVAPAELQSEQPAPDQLERWEEQMRVQHALEALGGRCEKLLRALFLDRTNVRYEAVAESVGIPVGSIGPTRARCLAKLAELQQDGEDR